MKLDFAIWPEGETRREFLVTANELHLASDTCIFPNAVAVSVTVQKSEDQVVAAGDAKTVATATCVRCLEEFALTVDERFRAVVRVAPPKEVTPDTGDDEFYLVPASEPVWDLSDVVRQMILLAVPDNPLCKEDCKGLCPGCGRNLNTEDCVCIDKKPTGGVVRLGDLIQKSQSRKR
jgi:uncharacterized protein